VQLVHLVLKEHQVLEETLAQVVPQDLQDLQAKQVHLDPQGQKEKLVILG
jgi:hypothetical protein